MASTLVREKEEKVDISIFLNKQNQQNGRWRWVELCLSLELPWSLVSARL